MLEDLITSGYHFNWVKKVRSCESQALRFLFRHCLRTYKMLECSIGVGSATEHFSGQKSKSGECINSCSSLRAILYLRESSEFHQMFLCAAILIGTVGLRIAFLVTNA